MTRSSETDSPVTPDGADADTVTSMDMPVNGFAELGLGTAILERLEGLAFRDPLQFRHRPSQPFWKGAISWSGADGYRQDSGLSSAADPADRRNA